MIKKYKDNSDKNRKTYQNEIDVNRSKFCLFLLVFFFHLEEGKGFARENFAALVRDYYSKER